MYINCTHLLLIVMNAISNSCIRKLVAINAFMKLLQEVGVGFSFTSDVVGAKLLISIYSGTRCALPRWLRKKTTRVLYNV
jgi:hypothetical protein